MSKKMLKRSLALGALMAFVITGSAMAAEKTVGISNNTTHKLNDSAHVFVQNSDLLELGSPTYEVSSNGIHITGAQPGEAINSNGVANLHAGELTIKTTNGGNGIYTVYGGQLTLAVDDGLFITSSGHGINSGTSADSFVTINADKTTVSIVAAENAIDARGNNTKIEINAKDVIVKSTNTGDTDANWKGYAVMTRAEGSNVEIDATGDVDITSARTAVYANKGDISVVGKTIDIIASEGAGVRAGTSASDAVRGNGSVVLGNSKTESVTIEGKMDYGIIARAKNNSGEADVQSSVIVKGNSLVIGANETSKIYAGICAASGTEASDKYNSTAVTVNAGYTEINADYGIYNMSNGNVTVNGDLTINANKSAIITRGYAGTIINGNNDEKITVQINGDIEFNKYYNNNTSVTDSNVVLNLSNADSFFKGNIIVTNGEKVVEANKATINEITGMNIALSNGATWELSKASVVNQATFGKDSVLNIVDGTAFEKQIDSSKDVFALNGAVNGNAVNALRTEVGAKIVIGKGEVGKTYNIASGFGGTSGFNWELKADNALWYVEWNRDNEITNSEGKLYHPLYGTIKAKTGEALVESGIATGENKGILSDVASATSGENATADAINELASSADATTEQIQKGAAALLQIGEAGGFTGNVVSVSKQVNSSVGARNSFTGPKHSGPRHRGGHGPSIADENNGSAIWAQYVHGKDKVDGIDMGGVENAYESQFNGVVLGADFKQVGSYASGIAFNYGEGDSHSKKNVVQSDSEFDFWGVSYYGAVKKQDTNVIFDLGYSESDSDVEQKFGANTITANPEASTWTAGVKVEKLIDKGAVQIVPYAGLRFMTIDTDDYEAKGATTSEATYYSTERQDIWLLPIGVSMSQENVYDSGWIVTPKADFSYTWAMGDTDSSMTVRMPGVGSDTLGYTVMDDGSFMATIGLDAQKEDWTFGVAYSYQKGDSTRSDRWYVNAKYSF